MVLCPKNAYPVISEGKQTSSKATADIISVMHRYFAAEIREYSLRDSGELGPDT